MDDDDDDIMHLDSRICLGDETGPVCLPKGYGVAYCSLQRVLAASCVHLGRSKHIEGAVFVYSVQEDPYHSSFQLKRVISTASESRLPGRELLFASTDTRGGYLAFMGPVTRRLLVMSEPGDGAVGLLDVAKGLRAGYVAPPGALKGAKGVAGTSCGTMVAVSAFENVHIFSKADIGWNKTRVFHHTRLSAGLRFVTDPSNGKQVLVAACWCGIVTLNVESPDGDGAVWMTHGQGHDVMDVEVCGNALFTLCQDRAKCSGYFCSTMCKIRAGRVNTNVFCARQFRDMENAHSMACVPGIGVVVRRDDFFFVITTHDVARMHAMSCVRVSWMSAVVRAKRE